MAARIAAAQTCTGGLGDPIVNITFGAGPGFGTYLPWVTGLTWQPADCPNDGFYTITSHTDQCFGRTWWDIPNDHTGDPQGYFMLINASYNPSIFYVQTISGLCGGTSYQFAAWVMNVGVLTDQIKPNVTFSITKTDGTVLNSGNTGDIPGGNPIWKQYAFYFTTPPGVNSVVLKMVNNAPGGIGNDLAIDDITFRAAGSTVALSAQGFPSDTIQVCDYAQTNMLFNSVVENCYPSQEVQWQASTDSGVSWQDIAGAGAASLTRTPTGAGQFQYRLLVAQQGNIGVSSCEVASKPIVVDVVRLPAPAVSIATKTSAACIGIPTHFMASPVDGGNTPAYQWMVNGGPAGQDSSGLTVPATPGGLVVECTMTSDAVCVKNPQVSSNVINLAPVPVPVQSLSIEATGTAVCKDSLVQFVAEPVNGGPDPVYQWLVNGKNAGSGSGYSTSGLSDGDTVNCIMTGSLTCSQPVSAGNGVKMTIFPLPVISLESAVVIAGGTSVQLQPTVTGNIRDYAWTPSMGLSNPTIVDPVASPVVTTAYQLYVTTEDGCYAKATERVEVYYPLQMPEGFTPNGDGRNDVFRVPPQIPVTIRSLAVFNRHGQRMFYTTDAGAGWDGRYGGIAQPAGTYVWELEFVNPVTNKVEGRKGTVILVR
jgi:gliding motility-associated-like protein